MKLAHYVEPLLQNPFAFYGSNIQLAQEDRINIVQNELILYYKGQIQQMKLNVQTAQLGQDFLIDEIKELEGRVKFYQ